MLLEFLAEQFNVDQYEIRDRMPIADPDGTDEVRNTILSTIQFLGSVLQRGQIASFARPFGGGVAIPMPTSSWEMDDFKGRFATSAVDPLDWWGPAERGSHWVFIDEAGYEAFWEEWCKPIVDFGGPPLDLQHPPSLLSPPSSYLPAFLRLPEVVKRTGLSRSTIYAKIASGSFPAQTPLGSRISVWQEDQIQAWIRSPT